MSCFTSCGKLIFFSYIYFFFLLLLLPGKQYILSTLGDFLIDKNVIFSIIDNNIDSINDIDLFELNEFITFCFLQYRNQYY